MHRREVVDRTLSIGASNTSEFNFADTDAGSFEVLIRRDVDGGLGLGLNDRNQITAFMNTYQKTDPPLKVWDQLLAIDDVVVGNGVSASSVMAKLPTDSVHKLRIFRLGDATFPMEQA